jgi:GGDEF domain-containing protein
MTPEQQRIAELEALVAKLTHDPSYGCLSRAGFELTWQPGGAVVFGDIDGMHSLNSALGYEQVNTLIRAALAALRLRSNTLVAGRWFSGDELVWSVPAGDAAGFAERIRAVFDAHGLSITLGIARAADDLQAAVGVASDRVQTAKKLGRRGSVEA